MSAPSLQHTLERTSVALVALGLLVVGLGTGSLLQVSARRDTDAALLSAAQGRARAGDSAGWQAENAPAAIHTRLVPPGDPTVPTPELREAVDRERPVLYDDGPDRVLLLCAETSNATDARVIQASPGDEPGELHIVIEARVMRPTLARTLGPFAAAWVVVSLGTLLGLSALARRWLARALAPLHEARMEAARVPGFGTGERLTVDGPEEVSDLIRTINALLDRLEAAWAAQVRFSGQTAHELRTPLAVLHIELDLALRRPRSPAETRETLLAMRETVSGLEGLVEALLSLSRLETETLAHAREPLQAAALAREAVSQEVATLTGAGNTLAVELRADPTLRGHHRLLVAALSNLLRNTARHAPGTPVALSVEAGPGEVSFTVRDGGPGFPEEGREALFSPFVRGTRAERVDPQEPASLADTVRGLGLGLAFAREVARRHGGECEILPGPGGAVRIRLPLR